MKIIKIKNGNIRGNCTGLVRKVQETFEGKEEKFRKYLGKLDTISRK